MAAKERIYIRLSRPVAGLASYSSLWQGPDHLLLATSTGYREQYQRFQFGDIQSFLITPSSRRTVWTVVLSVLSGLIALGTLVRWARGGSPIVSLVLLAVFLVPLVINLLRGPTCNVTLMTRIRTVKLPIRRRRKAEDVLGRLTPLIEAAQADLVEPTPAAVPSVVPPNV
ncbi:hypothetical protein DB347_01285 [Opitutaceae bacterium EW11]|nr:hypothetical protein DB347_01285 [Opitutaceae bacterium EW11]